MDLNDEESLLNRFLQSRSPVLFKALMRRYQNRLFNAAFRILGNAEEAEDVVQDTCLKIHQSIDTYNQEFSFSAWVFRIAHNCCFDTMRNRRRRKDSNLIPFDPHSLHIEAESSAASQAPSLDQMADPGPGPEEELSNFEQGTHVAKMLSLLPDSQRTVLVLHDVEGFSYQEISEIVGEKLGTVRSRIHYGRLRLRELLEPYFSSGAISQTSR